MCEYYRNKYHKYKSKYVSTQEENLIYPKIKPYNINYLEVDNIHKIYYEESGNPNGIPVLWLHGGPGGRIQTDYKRLFDPKKFRIIGFDQRGCGNSEPLHCLENNTTSELIKDIKKLNDRLKIDKCILVGNSWGSTLSLLYAIAYPETVLGMVIGGVYLSRQSEIDWLYKKGGVSNLYPKEWEIFENFIPENERGNMVEAYYKRLISDNEEIRNEASYNWCQLELKLTWFRSNNQDESELKNIKRIVPLAKIECHYFINNSNEKFMKSDNFIIENSQKLKNIPIIITQSRYDMICSVDGAYQLNKALPHSELRINNIGGHKIFELPVLNNYIRAINDILDRIKNNFKKN